jgi:anaerobic selenocysteine-containing dehydrogenase
MSRTVFRTCNVCEAMCGLAVELDENGAVSSIRGDADDVFSRGHLCPKGPAMREVLEDPARLRKPLRRTQSGFAEIGWTEALDEAGARLREAQEKHGRDSVGVYIGNPTVHSHSASLIMVPFLKALKTRNRFDANSQDANPKLFACMLMYGDRISITLPDVQRTGYVLMLGANPAASNGSVMTLGDVRGSFRDLRQRGGKLVLIDPRRTETAAWADEHHFIRPGGDLALVAALLHVLFAEKRVDEAALLQTTLGLAELKELVARFPPERVEETIGIDAGTIQRLAREFAAAKSAVAYGRVGTCQNPFGPGASWLLEALNVVTGNFDRPGGLMFSSPAVDVAALGKRFEKGTFGRFRSRVRNFPEFAGTLPASVMAEEMETPGPGQLKAFLCIAGNPVLSTPNGPRLARALEGLETMISVDYYLNETSRHAHLILPPVHALERGHYDVIFNTLAVRNVAKWSEPVVPAPEDALDDWDILYELAKRLGGVRTGIGAIDKAIELADKLGKRPSADLLLDLLLRLGPYGDHYLLLSKGLNLERLKAKPHGIDLGPLVPQREKKVLHEGGRVDLAPPPLLEDAARLDGWLAAQRDSGMVLIGRRSLRTNNSWMHNCASLVKGKDRATLLMHPKDAARLGLADAQTVKVSSRVGSVLAPLEVTDELLPGVVSLPHGYGHQALPGAGPGAQPIARATPGPNVNALTDELLVEPLIGTAILNGVPVQIEAA